MSIYIKLYILMQSLRIIHDSYQMLVTFNIF
jgi:hypothetical protein